MVSNSAKKSNTSKNQSNGNNENGCIVFPSYDLYVEVKKINNNENYKRGGLVFPSYYLYGVLEMINKNLSFLYTETGEEYDYEPIFDSPTRWYSDDFEEIYDNIKYNISVFKDIYKNDSRVGEFLYNNRLSDKFSLLFGSIYNAFIEAMYDGDNFDNEVKKMQNKKIKKIVRELYYIGIDPFTPQMI